MTSWGDQATQGMLANVAAARIPTRAAGRRLGGHHWPAVGEGLEATAVRKRKVQGQDRNALGGIAKGGVAQQQPEATHWERSWTGGRWRCRKAAALLRPQPAAAAKLRAVQGWPSAAVGRKWPAASPRPCRCRPVRPGRQHSPPRAQCPRRMRLLALGRRVERSWPGGLAGRIERARILSRSSLGARRVTSPASPLSPSSMARTAKGIAAAMARATRSSLAWATFWGLGSRSSG
jgi:hypothetical protein